MSPNDIFLTSAIEEDLVNGTRGDVSAAIRAGYRYLTGSAGRIDVGQARRYFQSACSRSLTAAAWLGWVDAHFRRDKTLARQGVARLQQAASAGDPVGQTLLGRVVERGWAGVRADQDAAKALYTAAAPRFALAKTYLAQILRSQDPKAAISLFQDAAAAGEVTAMNDLADLYLRKATEPKRFWEAKRLLRSAADRRDPVALFRLGGLSQDAPRRAFHYIHRSAQLGYHPALAATGLAYARGVGIPRNPKAARFWMGKFQAQA
jgi:TPR repeat protein